MMLRVCAHRLRGGLDGAKPAHVVARGSRRYFDAYA